MKPRLSDRARDVWVQIKAEAIAASDKAYEAFKAQLPADVLQPVGGPVESIKLPDATGKRTLKGKYHVIVSTDTQVYSRWQVLVCPPR
jgi:hypothetical protein